jgi:phosphoribosylformimino-5-aminoimidazole carboxamide ribotide isomerase
VRLFPAIDIQNGRCVRLRRGDFAAETVFADDPVAVARSWEEQGARYLHVVDLDGAREGAPRNWEVVSAIVAAVSMPVQLGGGVRTPEALERAAAAGVSRLVVGTSALLDEAFLRQALDAWGPRLVVGVDAEDGFVKTHGWVQSSDMPAVDFVRHLAELGVAEVVYTDISRDGMMQGVNARGIEALARKTTVQLIASGGVTDLDDLRALKTLEPLGVTGVIAGRALYEGRFTIAEAHAVLDGPDDPATAAGSISGSSAGPDA